MKGVSGRGPTGSISMRCAAGVDSRSTFPGQSRILSGSDHRPSREDMRLVLYRTTLRPMATSQADHASEERIRIRS